jgi:hypothetical protein
MLVLILISFTCSQLGIFVQWGTTTESTNFPTQYQTLIHKQTSIGWIHIFQGQIVTSWQKLQQYHYSSLPPVKGCNGMSWSQLAGEWAALWDAYNKSVYGTDSFTRAQAQHAQAIRELEILYSYGNQVLQHSNSLYYDTLVAHKGMPTRSIQQWLNSYCHLLLHSLALLHVCPLLTNYFNLA